jgi:NAD(P)-dependent dehydrogenase (short-subunit alcohol dehydrogenase family)
MRRAPRSVDRKVVFVTGAARGIGRATAALLVAEGARVIIADLDGELAAKAAVEVGAELGLGVDVTDHAAFTAALDSAERQVGPLDVLINNAGVMPIGRFEDETNGAAYRAFEINVFAVMHGTREAIRRMKPRGHGHIVNIASMAGVVPIPGGAVYSASKHAVVGFCESLWWELRGSGVDLSYVLPTLVNTELAGGMRRTRTARVIEPETVAAEVVGTLKSPRLAVYVPRSMGPVTAVTGLIPRALGNKLMTASGSDHLVLDSLGTPDRTAYQQRVDASAPAADARRAGPTGGPS